MKKLFLQIVASWSLIAAVWCKSSLHVPIFFQTVLEISHELIPVAKKERNFSTSLPLELRVNVCLFQYSLFLTNFSPR